MSHDLARYHRQMLLPGFSEAGQRKLLASKVLIVGCGALGTVITDMLARAGVGHLVVADRDYIELTNLQRQVLFDEEDVAAGLPKAEAARRKIARINSQVKVDAIVDDVNHANIEKLAAGCHAVIDGVDNFETRFLINDVAVKHSLPYIYGGAVSTTGMSYTILPHSKPGASAPPPEINSNKPRASAPDILPWEAAGVATPCLRCIFEEAPPPGMNPTCDTAGVIGSVVSIIANYQVIETLKVLTGNWAAIRPTLLSIDVWNNEVHQFKVRQAYDAGECPCCKQRKFEHLEGSFASATTTMCGRNAVQITRAVSHHGAGVNGTNGKLNFEPIAARLREHGQVNVNAFMIRADIKDHGKDYEITLFTDGRAIIKGTKDANTAKSIYAKYVGG